jgi:hypothetical protein
MMTPFSSDVYPDEKHAVLSPCSSKVNIAFFVVAYAVVGDGNSQITVLPNSVARMTILTLLNNIT